MRHDHDDPEAKALKTTYFQNVYPATSLYGEVNILKKSLSAILRKLERPTLTETRRGKLLRRAQQLELKINLILLKVEPTVVQLKLFNQRMEGLLNALNEMGPDLTEAKLIGCLESLGLRDAPHNQEPLQASSEPAEAKVLEALQSLSLTNTQGSSSLSTSSEAKLEKDETNKIGMGKNYQP